MGDLKTVWNNPPFMTSELSGDGVTSSGSDPNASGGDGAAGLTGVTWPDSQQVTTRTEMAESPNSVSKLPPLPNRFEPSATPPEPPSLQDRRPMNVDQT